MLIIRLLFNYPLQDLENNKTKGMIKGEERLRGKTVRFYNWPRLKSFRPGKYR